VKLQHRLLIELWRAIFLGIEWGFANQLRAQLVSLDSWLDPPETTRSSRTSHKEEAKPRIGSNGGGAKRNGRFHRYSCVDAHEQIQPAGERQV
jgi:hypothetical protein